MNIWMKSLLTGAVLATAVFFLIKKMNKKEAVLYDMEYQVSAIPDTGSGARFYFKEIIDVLEKRMEEAGYVYEVKRTGDYTIQVSLQKVIDTLSPYLLLTSNGKVQFRELYNTNELSGMLTSAIEVMKEMNPPPAKKIPVKRDSMSKAVSSLLDSMETYDQSRNDNSDDLINFNQLYKNESGGVNFPPDIGTVKLKDTATVRKLFSMEKVRQLGPWDMQLCFGEKTINKPADKENPLFPLYFLKTRGIPGKALLENEDVLDARQGFDQFGKTEILLEFNHIGARKWKTMTEQNIGRSLAIIINGYVVSAPTVLGAIPGGTASITGSYSVQEAAALAAGIKSGSLPCTLHLISSSIKAKNTGAAGSKRLLVSLVAFLGFSALCFFVLKTLRST